MNKYKKVTYTKSSNTSSITVRLPDTCKWWLVGHSNPLCFNYQYRSTDTPVNMTLGVIFGNSPQTSAEGSWWCTAPTSYYGDCMICSNSANDDDLSDGLNPCILWYSYPYSYACERENVPDSEIVDGKTNFEYRQEVCGNAPMPDNTNILIKDFEADSTNAFYFGCNIFATERYIGKMINTLTTKTMPGKYILFCEIKCQ